MEIVCHMITSLDGCILPGRWSEPAEAVDVSEVYEAAAKRLQGDGWIVGRITMAEYGEGITEEDPAGLRTSSEAAPRAHVGDRQGRPIAVAFDPKGRLHFSGNVLPTGEHLVVVLDPMVDEAHLAHLRRMGVSYVFQGSAAETTEREKLATALKALEENFGVKRLLLEGGGIINGSFLAAGLINEVSVLIYPGVDGRRETSKLFTWAGGDELAPSDGVKLKLLEAEPLPGGVVWLHYENALA